MTLMTLSQAAAMRTTSDDILFKSRNEGLGPHTAMSYHIVRLKYEGSERCAAATSCDIV